MSAKKKIHIYFPDGTTGFWIAFAAGAFGFGWSTLFFYMGAVLIVYLIDNNKSS